jgi:hypothetical protein
MEWIGNFIKRLIIGLVLTAIGWAGYYGYRVLIKRDAPANPAEFFGKVLEERSGPPSAGYGEYPRLPKKSFSTVYAYPFAGGWPYQVVEIPGATALETYNKLLKEGRTKGFWPVLLGDLNGLRAFKVPEVWPAFQPVAQEILQASLEVLVQSQIEAVKAADIKSEEFYAKEYENELETDETVKNAPAETHEKAEIWAHKDPYQGTPLEKVWLAIIPTTKSYEVPAYLNWPGTEATPSPDVQVAFLKTWNERYGAEVVAVMDNHFQIIVARPPATYEEALPLAYEQLAFCDNILDERYNSVRWLAKDLVGAKVWIISWE